jgi:hypothetical protein
MTLRTTTPEDIPQIQVIRNSLKENMLSNPQLITDEDCRVYITTRGRGWVCEVADQIVGFAVAKNGNKIISGF